MWLSYAVQHVMLENEVGFWGEYGEAGKLQAQHIIKHTLS